MSNLRIRKFILPFLESFVNTFTQVFYILFFFFIAYSQYLYYNIKGERGEKMEMDSIKEIIKNRRIELGLTQLEVAKAVGVSEATVSRWESGDIGDMRRSRIAALAKILKLNPNVLMGWKDEEEFQIGNLLMTQDDDLIKIINRLVNLTQDKLVDVTSVIQDILEMNDKQLEQLKKFIIVIKSNILD